MTLKQYSSGGGEGRAGRVEIFEKLSGTEDVCMLPKLSPFPCVLLGEKIELTLGTFPP